MRSPWPVVAVVVLACAACGREVERLGDLDEVQRAGELRVIVRPGFHTSALRQVGTADQRALLQQVASRLQVRLVWVQARRHDQILPWLARGRGDIAVSRFSPAQVRAAGFAPTVAMDWVDDLVVAWDRSPLKVVEDLGAVPLWVHRTGAGRVALLNQRLSAQQLWFVSAPESLSVEGVVLRVAAGRYPATVADSAVVEAVDPGDGSLRVVGPVAESRPLVWAVRAESRRLLAAVDDELFAEQVMARASKTAACRDLPEILRERVLRLVTRNSPTTCTVEHGGLEGFEYDLVLRLARELRVRLELVIPPPGTDPYRWLEQGFGDLAALHEPVDPELERRFLLTEPYRRVDMVTITSTRDPPPAAVEDLAGLRVAAAAPVGRMLGLLPLDPPVMWERGGPGADALSAIVKVQRGEARVAVVDSDLARLELPERPLQAGAPALRGCRLQWVMNPTSPRLRAQANDFLTRARQSGLVRLLARSELGIQGRSIRGQVPPAPEGALTPWDDLLRTAGREVDLDWRLLASVMYEESRFDPSAVGPGGSAGLFQFMPFTWRELNVSDPHDPMQAIAAGAIYLERLIATFPDVPLADRVAMGVASFNLGPRHVFDARSLAREMGLDPDRWAGNVETALILLDNPDVARRFPAGVCRCRRGAAYARRILRRYHAYVEQFPASGSGPIPL